MRRPAYSRWFTLASVCLLLVACASLVQEPVPVPASPTAALEYPTRTPDPLRLPTATFAPTAQDWAALGLSGTLYFTQPNEGLYQLSLASGEKSLLWSVPKNGYLAGLALSPTEKQFAFSYSAPPPAEKPQLGLCDLWVADPQIHDLQLVRARRVDYEAYSFPIYSPDGAWLYYSHARPKLNDTGMIEQVQLLIERLPLAELQTAPAEVVFTNAEQLSFSADGSRVAYQSFDPKNFQRSVYVADADGKNMLELVRGSSFFAINAVQISPDGKLVTFAASGTLQPVQSRAPWRNFLLSLITPAGQVEAHGPAWEIWSVPADQPMQLTRLTNLATDNPWQVWQTNGQGLMILQPGAVQYLALDQPGKPYFLTSAAGHGEVIWR